MASKRVIRIQRKDVPSVRQKRQEKSIKSDGYLVSLEAPTRYGIHTNRSIQL
jgi:hypothetical protein